MVDGVHVRVTVGFDDGAAYKFIFIGFVCENEFGEKEDIETLQLPDAEQKPEVKRAPGRPRKSTKKTTARKSTGTRKTTSRKAKK